MFNGNLNGAPLFSAAEAIRWLAEHPSPFTSELSKVNSLHVPLGPEPTRAWVLVRRGDLNTLDLDGQFTLTLATDSPVPITIVNGPLFVVREPLVIIPGLTVGDPNGVCLVELADERWLCKNPTYTTYINAQYNVRSQPYQGAPDYTIYNAESLNSGVPWTWATMTADIWQQCINLGTFPGLPWSPGGVPEGFVFQGVSAYDALNSVLARIGCALAQVLNAAPFTIVQVGAPDPLNDGIIAAAIANNQRIHDAEFQPITAGIVPFGCAVHFHRQEQFGGIEQTTATTGEQWAGTNVCVVQVAGGVDDAIPSIFHPIWDDLPAIYGPQSTNIGILSNNAVLPQATINVLSTKDFPTSGTINITVEGVPLAITYTGITATTFTGCTTTGIGTLKVGQSVNIILNSAALLARAQERTTDYFRMLVNGGSRLWQRFSGLLVMTPGSTLKGVSWRQDADGCVTEVVRHPLLMLRAGDSGGWEPVESKLQPSDFVAAGPVYPPMPQVLYINSPAMVYAQTTVAADSGGIVLPTGTISVVSTTGFPASGSIVINLGATTTTVIYTGLTATSFTGCTGGTGTLLAGDIVKSTVGYFDCTIQHRDPANATWTGKEAVWALKPDERRLSRLEGYANGRPAYFLNADTFLARLTTDCSPAFTGTLHITAVSWASSVVTFTTQYSHGLQVGDSVTVSGVTPAGYNGTYTVLSVPTDTTFTAALVANPGAATVFGAIGAAATTISGASWATGVATITATGHGLSVGDDIVVTANQVGWGGNVIVASVVDANHFTYALAANPGAFVSGSFIVARLGSGTAEILATVETATGAYRLADAQYSETVYSLQYTAIPRGSKAMLARDSVGGRLIIVSVVNQQQNIPAVETYFATATSDIPAAVGSTLGIGTADLDNFTGGTISDTGTGIIIYNPWPWSIASGVNVALLREPFSGRFYVAELVGATGTQQRCITTCTDPNVGVALANLQRWCVKDTLVRGKIAAQGEPVWALVESMKCVPCTCSGSGSGVICCPSGHADFCVSFSAPTNCVGSCSGSCFCGFPWQFTMYWQNGGPGCGFAAGDCCWGATYCAVTVLATPGGIQFVEGLGDPAGRCAGYAFPANWDCQSAVTATLIAGSTGADCACQSWPATITLTPGKCNDSGSGSSNCNCTGDCTGHSALAATYTNKVGAWTAMPDSATLACNAGGGSTTHAWANASPPTVFGQPQSSTVNCGASGTGAPQYIWTDAGGHNHAVTAQPGYGCNPLSAVFLVDDGAGDTMTVTVLE